MMQFARRVTGWVALVSYLVMGGLLYLWVHPAAAGEWPPDFRLMGYSAQSLSTFLSVLQAEARATYIMVLSVWDRIFIVSFAMWLACMGWRGGWLRFVVAGLAVLYAVIDLAENSALLQVIRHDNQGWIDTASHLTMAKFSSLYLCGLVLLVHLRRHR